MEMLSEKDLYCIARHMQTFIKQVWHKENDVRQACTLCQYLNECKGSQAVLNPWKAFKKLSQITGVNISPAKGFKV